MKLASVASEAWRNTVADATHLAAFAAAMFLLVGGLAAAEVHTTGGLVEQTVAYQAAGATVTTFTATGAIDGPTCQSLTAVAGVQAAGAIRSATNEPLALAALPAGPIPTFDATDGFLTVIDPATQAPKAGVWIPASLADTLTTRVRATVLTSDGSPMTIAAVYPFPSDGRATDLQNAIIEPVPADGTFDQCWVRTWPDNPNIVTLARMTLIADPPAGTTVTTGQLNPTLGSTFAGAALFADRATGIAWGAAAVIGFGLGAISIRIRRRHLAEARHAGVTVSAQLVQTLLETLAIPLAALPPAALACALIASPTDTLTVWNLGVRILLVGGTATLIGAASATLTIRQRALARYLKD